MNARISFLFAACTSLLVGCATPPQPPVPLAATTLTTPANKVGVAMSALPKVDTQFPGAACLLCLAAASVANSELTTYTRTLPYEDLPKLKDQVAEILRKKGTNATVIAEDL